MRAPDSVVRFDTGDRFVSPSGPGTNDVGFNLRHQRRQSRRKKICCHGPIGALLGERNETNDFRALNLSLKKFVGNSFYVRGGAEYRTIKASLHDQDWFTLFDSTKSSSGYSFEASMTSATFSIGNQWQFSRFTIGADWAGISIPLASNIQSETATITGTMNDEWQRRFDDAKNSLTPPLRSLPILLGRLFLDRPLAIFGSRGNCPSF